MIDIKDSPLSKFWHARQAVTRAESALIKAKAELAMETRIAVNSTDNTYPQDTLLIFRDGEKLVALQILHSDCWDKYCGNAIDVYSNQAVIEALGTSCQSSCHALIEVYSNQAVIEAE